jgi:hypothetical protein
VATYQQLRDDVAGWLNRRDVDPLIPGWVTMVETELAETLRSRPQITSGIQEIDSAYITMPPNFAAMASIRDNATGVVLELKDAWTGSWTASNTSPPAYAYRLTGDCIEFLPHPYIPDPPDPLWVFQVVRMEWYAKPQPLILPSDTNAILEQFYGVYLFGVMKYGALWALDDARAAQCDAQYQQMVTRANLWKQQSDYSGAPFATELAGVFD